ncbi:MAG: ABC transporter permease [Myxococcota bacterium]|jgi:ABC-2 type transport system permease protein|nr:ABC transporter permease [Myxococcota bacterium]
MSPRRVFLMARKEAEHVLRDSRSLYLALGIPLVLLLLFGYALTMDVDQVPLLVLDRDQSSHSRLITNALVRSGAFVLVGSMDSPDEAIDAFMRQEATAALIIEKGLARRLDRGERAQVQLLVDGTNANDASIASGYATAILQPLAMDIALKSLARRTGLDTSRMGVPLAVRSRNWFNQALRSQWYLVPGLIAVILAMTNVLLMALTVSREWERGTMEQLLSTPVRPAEILLGKLVPYVVIGWAQMLLVTSMGVLLFDVPLRGNLLLLFVASTLFLIASLGQGLLISVVARNQQVATMVAVLSGVLPSMLLSGFMSPIASMPKALQVFTEIIPARHFLVITRGIFLKGSGLDELKVELVIVGLFAVLLLAIANKRFGAEVK